MLNPFRFRVSGKCPREKKPLLENHPPENYPPRNFRVPATSIMDLLVKIFLISLSFQETNASSTVYSETNMADKIVLNVFGVAM